MGNSDIEETISPQKFFDKLCRLCGAGDICFSGAKGGITCSTSLTEAHPVCIFGGSGARFKNVCTRQVDTFLL